MYCLYVIGRFIFFYDCEFILIEIWFSLHSSIG